MRHMQLKEILENIGGIIVAGNEKLIIKNAVTRPDRVKDDTLFFDLGPMHGMNRAMSANKRCAIITQRPVDSRTIAATGATLIRVKSVRKTYWNFVRYYRGLFDIPVVNVTGTCGKTTTKEMIKHILSSALNVQATRGSYNTRATHLSHLLGIDDRTQAAVFEVSAAARGLLKTGGFYFRPTVGVLTNIGVDHLYYCKTLENYIKAKAELLDALGNKGTLIVNADDENTRKISLESFRGKVLFFGRGERADFQCSDVTYASGGMEFILKHKRHKLSAFVPGYGEHNVYNALAAVAASHAVGISIPEAVNRLRTFKQVERHVQVFRGLNGCIVIDDTWSSNPTSSEAALRVLKDLSKSRKMIAVFGRMQQLGEWEAEYHERVGKKVVDTGVDVLVTIGKEAEDIGGKALQAGMDPIKVHRCTEAEEAIRVLQREIDANSIILVKTSMLDSFAPFIKQLKGY